MSEREYRRQLSRLIADLDQAAHRVGRTAKKALVPTVLGIGLLLAADGCAYGDAGPGPDTRPPVADAGPIYRAPG